MTANKPEDCDLIIFESIRTKDLERAVALYEPNATFITDTGPVVGQEAIRNVLSGWMDLEEPEFTTDLVSFVDSDGELALVRGSWTALAKGPEGTPMRISGKNVELVRRQADGTWRFVIDHPRGAD